MGEEGLGEGTHGCQVSLWGGDEIWGEGSREGVTWLLKTGNEASTLMHFVFQKGS